jgi:hypothetical protein
MRARDGFVVCENKIKKSEGKNQTQEETPLQYSRKTGASLFLECSALLRLY